MGFSLGDRYPHITKSGKVVWIEVVSSGQAKHAEQDVLKHHHELATKGVKITSGVRGTLVHDIRSRPYWNLALDKVFNRDQSVEKIVSLAMKGLLQ